MHLFSSHKSSWEDTWKMFGLHCKTKNPWMVLKKLTVNTYMVNSMWFALDWLLGGALFKLQHRFTAEILWTTKRSHVFVNLVRVGVMIQIKLNLHPKKQPTLTANRTWYMVDECWCIMTYFDIFSIHTAHLPSNDSVPYLPWTYPNLLYTMLSWICVSHLKK